MSKPTKVYRWAPVLDDAGNVVKNSDGSDKYERGPWTGKWRVRYLDAAGKRRSEVYETEAAARSAERRRLVDAEDIRAGRKQAAIEAPLFADFVKEFTATYVAANNKHSERISKEKSYRLFLTPAFGDKRLDQITLQEVEKLKADMLELKYARKSVNNVLITLGKTLRYAKEVGVLAAVPTIKLLKTPPPDFDFLEADELERLVVAAEKEPDLKAAILAGAEAGLRSGELRALHLEDVDFHARKLTVRRSEYRGAIDTPKGGKARTIPLTARLAAAVKAIRHLKGPLVFCDAGGALLTEKAMTYALARLCKRAGLREIGWHSLRHTFCSHLAMRGAAARAIQELAGHANLATTQRYMHLSPNSTREAIALLERGGLPVDSASAASPK